MMQLTPCLAECDLRKEPHRREMFLRFYLFHLRHRAHPGCVYYLIPYLRDILDWGPEETLWFALLNGYSQNPVTSLLLHQKAPTPDRAGRMIEWWADNYDALAVDTDRRHHKPRLSLVVNSYLRLLDGASQASFWYGTSEGGFSAIWEAATSIETFGRLSAFSFAEYLRIAGVPFDCDTLFLDDRQGSRSHRNGLAIVAGMNEYDWHESNPDFDGRYPYDVTDYFEVVAHSLLVEAQERAAGEPWAGDVNLFTLESALCTYKSWHRPNRRYPNVYNDMLHDRLVLAGERWRSADLDIFWNAREDELPDYLRLEVNPTDPGVHPLKQNHYRFTGETVMMGREDPELFSTFDRDVDEGRWGKFR